MTALLRRLIDPGSYEDTDFLDYEATLEPTSVTTKHGKYELQIWDMPG